MKIDRGGDEKDNDDGSDNGNENGNDSAFDVNVLAACKVCNIGRRVNVTGRRMIISWVLGGSC